MTVTVGIATTGDHPEVLRHTVEHAIRSAELTGDGAEVLVVVNGRDRLPELAMMGADALRVVFLDRRNVALARNTVIAEARHDTILFTDDDCVVPPEWCSQLGGALRDPGTPVVTAPVKMDIQGPVSAYFDYQRLFDATPHSPGRSLLVVTTNCGIRRDRIPRALRFDTSLNSAGEDTNFGLALGEAGIEIRWLADATPLRHGLSERIEEVTERFMRNGRSGPALYLHNGRNQAAMPGIMDLYRSRMEDTFRVNRRFGEFVAPEARTAFAVLDSLFVASMIIGYLDGLGTLLDQPLLELDLPSLRSAWTELGQRLRERTAGLSTSDWADLRVDYSRMRYGLGESEPLLRDVQQALRQYAPPVATDPSGPIGDVLTHGAPDQIASFLDDLDRVRQVWAGLGAGEEPLTPDQLNRAVRDLGVPFKVAGDAIELSMMFDFQLLKQRVGAKR